MAKNITNIITPQRGTETEEITAGIDADIAINQNWLESLHRHFCLTEVRNCHIIVNTAETVATVERAQTMKYFHKIFLWPKMYYLVVFMCTFIDCIT